MKKELLSLNETMFRDFTKDKNINRIILLGNEFTCKTRMSMDALFISANKEVGSYFYLGQMGAFNEYTEQVSKKLKKNTKKIGLNYGYNFFICDDETRREFNRDEPFSIELPNGSTINYIHPCDFINNDTFRYTMLVIDSIDLFKPYEYCLIDKLLLNKGKLIITSSLHNEYIYQKFCRRYEKNTLLSNEKLISLFYMDNPYMTDDYKNKLSEHLADYNEKNDFHI
jgi:hypothetical protein